MRRVVVLVLALAALCVGRVSPPAAAAPGVSLAARAVERSVRLGEDITLVLTVDNPTLDPVTLPELRLAADALSIRVRGAEIEPAVVTRLYGEFEEDREDGLRLAPVPTRSTVVPAGGRITAEVAIAAVATGTLELTVRLGEDDATALVAEPVAVEVTTSGNDRKMLARVETTGGAFTIEVDGRRAFNAVSHFWSLARSGFYGDLPIHRVLPGRLAQTGDPRGDGTGTAGWYLPAEPSDAPPARGDVALARGAHADSISCQWFVSLSERAEGDERFTPLGRVIEGLEVLDALDAVPSPDATPPRVLRVRTAVR